MTSIDATETTGVTIDGEAVSEITADGDTVWVADMIDSFEDGDISEYAGDTASYAVKTGTGLPDGTQMLSATDNTGPHTITSLSGLPQYPSRGDSFQVWFYVSGADYDEFWFTFCAQNAPTAALPSGYSVEFNPYQNHFRLLVDSTVLDAKAIAPSTGWYYVNVSFDHYGDGEIVAALYNATGTELARTWATNTKYTTGGIGFVKYIQSTSGIDWVHTHNVVEESPDAVVYDSFEGGTVSSSGYTGGTSYYTVTSTRSSDGTYSLTPTTTGAYDILRSPTGYTNPSAGDVFAFDQWNGDATEGRTHLYLASDAAMDTAGYWLRVNWQATTGNRIYDRGTRTTLVEGDWLVSRHDHFGQWNTVYVDFRAANSGQIRFWMESPTGTVLFDMTASTSAYSSGYMGWGLTGWADQYVDNLRQIA